MQDNEFQTKVLAGVESVQKQTETLIKGYDRLDGESKKSFEELTKVKNAVNDQAETLAAIRRVQANIHRERLTAFGDPMKRLLADPDKREALNMAIRVACQRPMDIQGKAGAIAAGSTPGSTYLIGDLASEIYSVLSTYGVYNTFAVRPLSTKTTTFPVATARPVASFITAEGGQISEDSSKDGTSVDCTPLPIAVLLYASKQMVEDSEFDIASMLMDDFAQAFAYRLDWAALAADGTNDATDGGFTGVFAGGTAAAAANGNTTIATLDFEDVLKCLSTVAASVLRRGAKWWIHPAILAKLIGVKDANGRSIFLTSVEAPSFGGIGSILGYPVVLADAAPSTDAASQVIATFGDPNGLVIGMRTSFEFETSDQYKFDYLRRYFRGVGRAGVKVRAATAFANLTLAAQ